MRIERIAGNVLYFEFAVDTSLAQSSKTINRFQISNVPSFDQIVIPHMHVILRIFRRRIYFRNDATRVSEVQRNFVKLLWLKMFDSAVLTSTCKKMHNTIQYCMK